MGQKKGSKTAVKAAAKPHEPRWDLWIVLLLLIAIAIVYGQVFDHDFLNYDDPKYVSGNAHVRGGLTGSGMAWAFGSAHDGNWIPLTWLSHMLDCQLFGLRSGPQHLTNVVLHAANSILLFFLFMRLTKARWPSAFVAFTFALHPLHVESVAWIAERKDVLSTLFFLLAIWAYLNYVERPGLRRYAIVAALFCCGLMSKPMVVTLPFVLLLLDFWPLRRRAILEKAPLLVLAAAASAIAFLAQQQTGAVAAIDVIPAGLRLANAIVSYIAYIFSFLWPSGLAVLYPYPAEIAVWEWAGAAVLVAGLTVAAVWWSKRRPYFTVGWFWFLGTLLPVIGLIQVGVQSRADRYMYIPMIGLTIVVAWGASEFGVRRFKNVLAYAATAICTAWAVVAWISVQYWENSMRLFEHALEVTNGNFVAHNNLADEFMRKGRNQDAIVQFTAASRIRPNDATVLDNLGVAFETAGRPAEAVPVLNKAIQIAPAYYKAHVDLGSALMATDHVEDAVSQFEQALRTKRDDPQANYALGGALMVLGRVEEARPHLLAALPKVQEEVRNTPEEPNGHYNLGRLYVTLGRIDEAIPEFSEAVRLAPGDAQAHLNLGLALAERGRKPEALDQFAAAVRIDPGYVNARLNLARTLADLGRDEQSVRAYQEILQSNPNLEEARREMEQILRGRKQ